MIRRIKNYLRNHTKYGKSRYLNYLYRYDMEQYFLHSCMSPDNDESVATQIRILSHAIEKGMSLPNCRKEFGKEKIKELIDLYFVYQKNNNRKDSQALDIARETITAYYKFQKDREADVEFIPNKILLNKSSDIAGIMQISGKSQTNFKEIAFNRHSSRSYAGTEVSDDLIRDVIAVAQTAPSACNRQATRIYACKNKTKIKELMQLHGGIRSFETPGVIFAITGDLNLYQNEYERNTIFLDGGIFTMNLLYSLDSFGLVACPVIWGNEPTNDSIISKMLNIPSNEKVVCLITAGVCPDDGFKAACSPKRKIDEILHII